jgi:CBS domain-containing protein
VTEAGDRVAPARSGRHHRSVGTEIQGQEQGWPWLSQAADLRRSGEAVLGRLRGLLESAAGEMQGPAPLVVDLMSRAVRTCTDDDTLDVAARILWETDCGCVPVVTRSDPPRVVGMLTDRDICMAGYTTGSRPSEIRVGKARSRQAWCCPSTATVDEALAIMRHRQVHRLPVVDAEGVLIGLLSLADVAARGPRPPAWLPLRGGDPVAATFTAIRERRRP